MYNDRFPYIRQDRRWINHLNTLDEITADSNISHRCQSERTLRELCLISEVMNAIVFTRMAYDKKNTIKMVPFTVSEEH